MHETSRRVTLQFVQAVEQSTKFDAPKCFAWALLPCDETIVGSGETIVNIYMPALVVQCQIAEHRRGGAQCGGSLPGRRAARQSLRDIAPLNRG